jgi:hypothetical protein
MTPRASLASRALHFKLHKHTSPTSITVAHVLPWLFALMEVGSMRPLQSNKGSLVGVILRPKGKQCCRAETAKE